ncbi:MAG TPA: hypothetical protein VHT53_03465, partial [Candidatus Elarobacter sp.]|nr:hypothetical protein [Candidatus Elarobacter sp.]
RRSAVLVHDVVEAHANGSLRRTPQSEVARELGITEDEIARTLTHPLRKDDLFIDWSQPAHRIVDHVRSLSPQPAARTERFGEPIKVLRAHAEGDRVVLDIVVPPGRGPMAGDVYLRTRRQTAP